MSSSRGQAWAQPAELHVILLGLMLFTLPLNRSVTAILFALWGLHAVVRGTYRGRFQRKDWVWFALFTGYFGMLLLGVFWSEYWKQGWIDMKAALPMLVGPLAMLVGPAMKRRQVYSVVLAFCWGCVAALIICLVGAALRYHRTGDSASFYYHNLTDHVGIFSIHFSLFVSFALLTLGCLIFATDYFELRLARSLHTLVMGFLLVGLVMLSARMVIGAFAAAASLAVLLQLSKRIGWPKSLALVVGALALLATTISFVPYARARFQKLFAASWQAAYREEYGNISDNEYQNELTIRLIAWRLVFDATEDSWLLGVGTGDTQGKLDEGWRRVELDKVIGSFNAHNQYLQGYLAVGLVGALVLVLALVVPLYLSIRHGELLYTLFLVLVMLCFLTESYLIRQHGAMFYGTVNAVLGFGLLQRKRQGLPD